TTWKPTAGYLGRRPITCTDPADLLSSAAATIRHLGWWQRAVSDAPDLPAASGWRWNTTGDLGWRQRTISDTADFLPTARNVGWRQCAVSDTAHLFPAAVTTGEAA